MTAIIISFILGAAFGVLSTCLIAAGRRDDDIKNISISTKNASEYDNKE